MASGDDIRLITSCLARHRATQGAPTAIVELSAQIDSAQIGHRAELPARARPVALLFLSHLAGQRL